MNGILDSILTKAQTFRPQNVTEYTALQLAKKLSDTDRLWEYLALFDRNQMSLILESFVNAQGRAITRDELITAFDDELTALTEDNNNDEL
jgi:hypothetical protein